MPPCSSASARSRATSAALLSSAIARGAEPTRSEEHTSELQSPDHLVCRLLLEKKKTTRAGALLVHDSTAPRGTPCAVIIVESYSLDVAGSEFDLCCFFFFFFNDTAAAEIYTLSLHDALPICRRSRRGCRPARVRRRDRGRPRRRSCLQPSRAARSLRDRKSTRLNSSHQIISYAVFCLKKKKPRGLGRC